MLIREVRRYSDADRKGIEVGDIIIEANRQNIKDVDDLRRIINKLDSGDSLILLIRRETEGKPIELIRTLKIPE